MSADAPSARPGEGASSDAASVAQPTGPPTAVDPAKFSTVAHARISILNPVGTGTLDAIAARLRLDHGGRILDVGCGRGEWVVRILERFPATAVGIDRSEMLIEDARARAAARLPEGRASFQVANALDFPLPPAAFDVAISLGATHALGGLHPTLRRLADTVRVGGRVVVGEGYWKRPPSEEYLGILGATKDEFGDHPSNERSGAMHGLRLVTSWRSTLREWDDYESRYAAGVHEYVRTHPGDPDVAAMRRRIEAWEDGYRRWGRSTLGFGIYLFERGSAAGSSSRID